MVLAKAIATIMMWISTAMAAHNEVPAKLRRAIEYHESRGSWTAVSKSGCVGVMQIMPKYSKVPRPLLFIGPINRLEGARHLRYWHRRANGDWRLAIAAYGCGNAGLRGECGQQYAQDIIAQTGEL